MPAKPGAIGAPRILFPPDGALVDRHQGAGQTGLPLKVEGGEAPLVWIVNGAPLPRAGFTEDNAWQPDGVGFVRIAVVDAAGRNAQVRVRVVERP